MQVAVRGVPVEQGHFAEIAAACQIRQHQLATRMLLATLSQSPGEPDKNCRPVRPDVQITCPGRSAQLHAISQVIDEVRREWRQHRNAAQVRFQRALPVCSVQLIAKGLVALHDVEHVAQHLEHRAVGRRAHRGRTRVKAHAGHFAEQIARA